MSRFGRSRPRKQGRWTGGCGRTAGAVVLTLALASCGAPDPAPPASESTRTLSLVIDGSGTVHAASGAAVVSCAASCDLSLEQGASVQLTAAPDVGLGFAGWGDACTGLETCLLDLDDDRIVSARFRAQVLTLFLVGDANVRALISPGPGGVGSLVCDRRCASWYDAPVAVSVNLETIESGSEVGEWTGCPTAVSPTFCYLNVEGPVEVTQTVVHPPTAQDDTVTTIEDTTLVVPAPGVLANDSDSPGDPLRADLDAAHPAAHGTVTLGADGGFHYRPEPDFAGRDRFRYWVTDAYGNRSAVATAELEIAARNDAPSFAIPADPPSVKDGAGPQRVPGFATELDAGGGDDERSQALHFSVTLVSSTGTLSFEEAPTIDPDGALHFTARPGTYGAASLRAVLVDDGGTAHGGVDTSEPRSFTVTVVPLRLTLVVHGNGAAVLDPAGDRHAYGTVVTITAEPDPGTKLRSWGGACADTSIRSKSCVVTVVADTYVSVNFAPVDTLAVGLLGGGDGRVISDPSGIDCASGEGGTCSAQFLAGETVELSAAPAPGSVFTAWEGCVTTGPSTCDVVLDGDRAVVARFDPTP